MDCQLFLLIIGLILLLFFSFPFSFIDKFSHQTTAQLHQFFVVGKTRMNSEGLEVCIKS